jgi:dipeptidase E
MVFVDTCLQNRKYEDSELAWHYANKKELTSVGFNYEVYNIAGKSEDQIKSDLDKYSIMYIEGGNTPYLLQQSLLNNFGNYVTKRVNEGMIYISTSAGSVIVGPDISSNGRPGKTSQDYGLTSSAGYGILDFVVMPHWGDPKKKSDYSRYKVPNSYNESYPHIFLSDNQYIEVMDDWYKIIDITEE